MGNCTSCCYVDRLPPMAKLIDVHGNLRYVKVPITAAEIMLEEPGLVVSPADDLRQNSRLTALPADDKLNAGKLYMLIPRGRVHAKVSKSEMERIDQWSSSSVKRRRAAAPASSSPTTSKKQCWNSKVGEAAAAAAHVVTEEEDQSLVGGLEEEKDNGGGFTSYVMAGSCRQWKPVLEPIFEGHCGKY